MELSQFNWVDWVLVAALVYGAVVGLIRGLSREMGSLLGLVIAVLVTRMAYEPISAWICEKWNWNPQITRLFVVALLLVVGIYAMRVLRLGLGALMSFAFKGWVERVGGMLAGIVRLFLYGMVLLLVASFIPWSSLERAVMFDSQFGKTMIPYLQSAYNTLANKVDMLSVELPTGVEEPHVVMPPVVSETLENGSSFIDPYWPDR